MPVVHHVQFVDHPLDATVVVPGSKSIANRALICATLADGESVLRNVPGGDDTAAMAECVALLGAGIAFDATDPTIVTLHGTGGALRPGPMTLQTRLAGTTSRFVTALCALGAGHYEIDGLPPLRSRPMAPLHDALAALGADVTPGETWGHLPVSVGGIPGIDPRAGAVAQSIDRAGAGPAIVAIAGDISSQYITALMLIGPYLPGGLRIELTTPLISRPYVAITAAVMGEFGIGDIEVGDTNIVVPAGRYVAGEHDIEPDASSASYALAAAAVCGGTVRVAGLGPDALQGDAAFADLLGSMGCDVVRDETGTSVTRHGDLRGIDIDMSDLSDLVPTLAVVAPFATTATTIRNVGFIRGKESDRIGDLVAGLVACGVDATETADGLHIEPGVGAGGAIDTHHDHRLAMAFGVMGMAVHDMRVHDPDVVTKSWPDFWTAIEQAAR